MRAPLYGLIVGLTGCLVDIRGPLEGFEGDYVAEEATCPADLPEEARAELSIDVQDGDIAFYFSGVDFETATGCVVDGGNLVCGLQDEWECSKTEAGLDCEHFEGDRCVWHFERW